jgi:hypothetical protein
LIELLATVTPGKPGRKDKKVRTTKNKKVTGYFDVRGRVRDIYKLREGYLGVDWGG